METIIILFIFAGWVAFIYVSGLAIEAAEKKIREIKTSFNQNRRLNPAKNVNIR